MADACRSCYYSLFLKSDRCLFQNCFFLFAVIDCILMVIMHQLWKKLLPSFYRYFGETRKLLIVADREYAENVIRDVSGMKDFTYELIGIILSSFADGDTWTCH